MPHIHTNKLVAETSPYLLQHAHNPVNWYPWGPEALQRAADEDKIILVSIGYSACHWCHVMERESFEDEHVAALMNEYFINIKIDREERPDLDHIYMDAVQAMTGSGGWPLNVFLTPDTRPFYGGTYFPPVKAHGRASWTDVLTGVQQAWTSRRDEITEQAGNLTSHLVKASGFGLSKDITGAEKLFTKEQCDIMFGHIMKQADTVWGGFGNAPKFPQTAIIQYLLQYHHFTGNKAALQQALLSLDKMLDGGIYDQVGGGLARYSTDTEWLAPHFEKMLYDNALLVAVLCDAYQVSGNKKYAAAIRHTLAFAQRELYDPQAGFYAAIDADSEGEEGLFYTWEKHEIDDLLGPDAALFCAFYDVSEKGNWEGRNILRRLQDPAAFAAQHGMTGTELEEKLEASLDQLLAARNQRVRPGLDDKILLGWNALMITALCKAAASLGEKGYLELAKSTFNIILSNFRAAQNTHSFHHTFKAGIARYPAFLDDYAFLIQACITLQENSSATSFLAHAKQLTEQVIADFSDEKEAGFFYTGIGQTDLLLRKKEVYDGATPSGNSIMATNLFYLSIVFDNPQWYRLANEYTAGLQAAVIRYPTSFPVWASLILQQAYGVDEIAVIGNGYADLRDEILRCYMPGKVLQCSALVSAEWPLFSGKKNGSETWIYRCRNYACRAPVKTLSELLIQAADPL